MGQLAEPSNDPFGKHTHTQTIRFLQFRVSLSLSLFVSANQRAETHQVKQQISV